MQLQGHTCKAESENKETQDKVRARGALTTDSGEETTEMGQQIAKADGHPDPASVPNSPRERGQGRGQTDGYSQLPQLP